ncbi:hypothetical protein BC938DRAFT_474131, partial [Jimgerdemannia flammicorona]
NSLICTHAHSYPNAVDARDRPLVRAKASVTTLGGRVRGHRGGLHLGPVWMGRSGGRAVVAEHLRGVDGVRARDTTAAWH